MSFDSACQKTLGFEGGYSDSPDDSGGKTRYGITEAVARAEGYKGDMRNLPLWFAKRIYRKRYWDAMRLDDVGALSSDLSAKLFDIGVNMGNGEAVTFLQRSLNAMNDEQTYYSSIKVDGDLGPKTVATIKAYADHYHLYSPYVVLLRAINALQGTHYIDIYESRPKDGEFVFGWFNQRIQ